MNEIRMYVEHLFENRTLTPEMIELKEEIYGNLMARYEDYLGEGMGEVEALEKTKASITDIDDVIAGDSETGVQADDSADAKGGLKERFEALKKNPKAKKVVIALVVLALVAGGINFAMDFAEDKREQEAEEQAAQAAGEQPGKASEPLIVTIDQNGDPLIEGEPGDELLKTIVEAKSDSLKPFAGTKLDDSKKVEELLRSLPMGDCIGSVDVTKDDGVLGFTYEKMPEAYDGESSAIATAYNVMAIFAVMPQVDEIEIDETEAGEPNEKTHFVYTREDAEAAAGFALDEKLLEGDGWNHLKEDALYRQGVAEGLVEKAEKLWK